MKLRTLGVALLASCGLALAVLPASVAAAQTPYPPSDCGGSTGDLELSQSVVTVGSSVVWSACGFTPGASVTMALDGADVAGVVADATGSISGTTILTAIGDHTLTGRGTGVPKKGLFGEPETDAPILQGLAAPVGTVVPLQAPVSRVVSATVHVVDHDGKDMHGNFIPIPIPIPIPIGGFGNNINDGRDGSCFGNGNRDDRNVVDNRNIKDGKGTLADDGTGLFNDNNRQDNNRQDNNRRDNNNCTIIGAGVGVGVTDVGVGGLGVGGAGAGAGLGVGGAGVGGVGGAGATPAGGALPFTGVETGAMASIALALLGGGLLLRVAARRRRNAVVGMHTEV
jgi:hypothetical protein